MTHHISLNRDAVALVDDADYDRVTAFKWFLSGTGYAVGFVPVDGQFKLTYLHRFLMDAQPGQLVDHINGAPLDNQRENLRIVTAQQNGQNKRVSPLSHTGLKGVGWQKDRQKYHTRIQFQGIRHHLGYFDDPEMAALAYDYAARQVFGEFAMCNYPDRETPEAVARQVRERMARRGLKLPETPVGTVPDAPHNSAAAAGRE
jgi:hypothetical protein